MDLFYQQSRLQDQVKALKKDIKSFAKVNNLKLDKSFKTLYGNLDSVGNCILIIQPPHELDAPFFKGKDFKFLLEILGVNGITNFFATYSSIFSIPVVSKKDIQNFAPWITKIVDIVQPHTIIVLGEEAPTLFNNHKFMLKDHHGTIIETFLNIPVILTYHMSYFLYSAPTEDITYKEYLREHDWKIIKERYTKVTK